MKIFEQSKAGIRSSRYFLRFLLSAFFLPLIFLFQLSDVLAAPSFGPNILVSDDDGQFNSSVDGPPILDVDIASGVYVAWIDHRNFKTEVFFSKLTPNASGFSSNIPLTGISNIKSFPQIEEAGGNIYISWGERRLINNTVSQGVFFTKSTDGGATFSEEIFLDSNDDLPINMIARDNKIFISYSKNGNQIWLASSSDGGSTFSTSIVSDSTNFLRHRPSVDFKNNNVYVSWYDERSGLGDVFFAKSTDGGVTFGPNKSIYANPNSAMNRVGPYFGRQILKVSPEGQIYIAFDYFLDRGNSNFDFEVYFIKSSDDGETFTNALRLSDDPLENRKRQSDPSLTILPDGSPVVAWFDERDAGSTKAMLSYSQDKGQTFSANINISNTPSPNTVYTAPTVVSDSEGKIHYVRGATILSQPGIWYTKIDLGISLNIPPSPSPSPSPPPTPTPFLDLPWDYESQGLTFNEAALAINSYFDHEYPFLSSGMSEPISTTGIISFDGLNLKERFYSSHDGYDYGTDAKVEVNTPVLAAADGTATLGDKTKCWACGNHILIDHGNGYQTRYYHLAEDSPIIQELGTEVQVTKGQEIGKNGATGNVTGAHIHFMVVQDKDGDGNFENNIPDGITDPFGWQSTEQDPWPEYSWKVGNETKTGNSSYYLWTKPIANLSDQLTSNGGFFQLERFKLNFPQGAAKENLKLEMKSTPLIQPSKILKSIGSSMLITAKNVLDFQIKSFFQPFIMTVDFSNFDISKFKPETISIYSSEDGINWTKEETAVDFSEKTASANINHLSYFALMGERADTIAPTTTTVFTGDMGQESWFRSNVQLALNATDNESGLGVDYTLYKIGNGDWEQYTSPLNFTDEGNHKVYFYSVDKDENAEDIKSIEFNIDKTIPEAKINIDLNLQDLVIEGVDSNHTTSEKLENINTNKKDDAIYVITDPAGNTLKLDVRYRDKEKRDKLRVYSMQYNNDPIVLMPDNRFNVNYYRKDNIFHVKEQNYELKGEVKIRIKYDFLKDESTITANDAESEKVKEIKRGLILLQLITNQGNLEYSYQ